MRRTIALFFVFAMLAAQSGCGRASSDAQTESQKISEAKNWEEEIIAETYSIYGILVEEGAQYQAYDPKGNRLELLDGRFALKEAGDYSYSKAIDGSISWYKVVAQDTIAPEITLDYTKKYVRPGSSVMLPEVNVTDSDGTTAYTIEVSLEGAEVPVSAGCFQPQAEGEYLIRVTASDQSQNVAEQTATVTCTSDEALLNCIFEMDTVYGLEEQTSTRLGMRLQLSQEEAPDGRNAVKIKLTPWETPTSADTMEGHLMFFCSPLAKEWKDNFSGIYFYVKNLSDNFYVLEFMDQEVSYVTPGNTWLTKELGWQRVEITDLDRLLPEDDCSYLGMIDMDDCNGLYLRAKQAGSEDYKYGELLMSSIYGIPKITNE